jgi:hypothetical protein
MFTAAAAAGSLASEIMTKILMPSSITADMCVLASAKASSRTSPGRRSEIFRASVTNCLAGVTSDVSPSTTLTIMPNSGLVRNVISLDAEFAIFSTDFCASDVVL